ncbi:MAG: AAA family ATPase, partial [Candidatus Eremiobacteraeota bacterium]|nr:AAA family ATPase [Candidatus Eremiobacteraeota bacterium]
MVVDVLAAPACAAALVVGEPGAGKSRALAQARRRWEAAGTDVFSVTCLPGAATVAFDPLITLARTLYAQGRLPLRVQRAVAANRMQSACEAFERAASAGPLTIQIDDLHCADPDTLAALRYCIDRLRDLPLAWNIATRPGRAESDELGAVLARAQQADVIELDGLRADEVGALARALAPDRAFDDDAVARLHERTGGNPLYVELLVQDRNDELAPSLRRALAERVRALAPDALAVA